MRNQLSVLMLAALVCGCDDDDNGGVGARCLDAQQCFLGLDVAGDAVCLDRVEGGYCTHECDTDADCCSAQGECPNGKEQVCAPFESTGQRLCFLSCEGETEDGYCSLWANADFECRSSGGGSKNRKVCVP